MRKTLPLQAKIRKDAGVADRDGLENRCTGNRTEGSNPSLSAECIGRRIFGLRRFFMSFRSVARCRFCNYH